MKITGSTKADHYNRIPSQSELTFTSDAAYAHITTNNTIEGTEWRALPDLDSDVPLKPGATKQALLDAMQGHILAEGQLMGKYQRR